MNDLDGCNQRSKPESDERLLARRYMLGGLSAQQQDEVERRFLFDPAFEDIVLEEETDLLDALAAGRLSSEHERALRVWASASQRTQSRLDAAFVFNRVTSTSAQRPAPYVPVTRNRAAGILTQRVSAMWLTGVAAASLALITATLWVTHSHPVNQIPASVAVSQPAPAIAKPVLPSSSAAASPALPARPVKIAHVESTITTFLMAEETRGSSAVPRLHLTPGTNAVTLQLTSQTGLPTGPHSVELTGADGSAVQITALHARRLHSQSFLEVTLDAAVLRAGEYTVLMHSKDTPGSSSPLVYHFQIVAP